MGSSVRNTNFPRTLKPWNSRASVGVIPRTHTEFCFLSFDVVISPHSCLASLVLGQLCDQQQSTNHVANSWAEWDICNSGSKWACYWSLQCLIWASVGTTLDWLAQQVSMAVNGASPVPGHTDWTASMAIEYGHISITYHEGFIAWKLFPHYWPFVRGVHRSPVHSQYKRPVMQSFYDFLYAGLKNGRIMPWQCPSVRLSVRVFRTFLEHALRYQFETWYLHSVGGTTCRIWVASQLGHFDLVYSQK